MNWTLAVKKNRKGELYVQLPSKLLKLMKWKTGDDLEWTENKDGSYSLSKHEKVK
jgi:bifunctional DNA-binding transcriptional regulator/antitoxin component of YhaV-PrlF toxin-antitoxin module